MLIEFKVSNYLSFKEEESFSMIAASDKSLEDNLIKMDNYNVLKSAILYGPNASGKTNLLVSIGFLRYLVVSSYKDSENKIELDSFKLDDTFLDKPTKFEIMFIKNKIRYLYTLLINKNRILEENLFHYPKGRKSYIFKRTEKTFSPKNNRELNFVNEKTANNILYLSMAGNLKVKPLMDAYLWFKENVRMDLPINPEEFNTKLINEEKGYIHLAEVFLRAADMGIHKLECKLEKSPPIEETLPKDFPPKAKKAFEDMIVALRSEKKLKSQNEEAIIKTYHEGMDIEGKKKLVPFELGNESSGTISLFKLSGPIYYILKNGYTLFFDEMDTSIHPLIVEVILKLFNDPLVNRNNAQLIFTTHNTAYLDLDNMRRDQIWFVEKRDDGSSELYSLVQYHPRKDHQIEKRYREGRYGAIPFFDLSELYGAFEEKGN